MPTNEIPRNARTYSSSDTPMPRHPSMVKRGKKEETRKNGVMGFKLTDRLALVLMKNKNNNNAYPTKMYMTLVSSKLRKLWRKPCLEPKKVVSGEPIMSMKRNTSMMC
jgi:hypothetical protein